MFWRSLSLQRKLLALTLVGIVCMGLFSFVLMRQAFSNRQHLAREDVKSKSEIAARTISASFRERYMDVQTFAENSVFLGQNKEAMTQALTSYVETYKVYDAIIFADSEGKFVVSNAKTFDGNPIEQKQLEGRIFAETSWFQRAVKGQFLEDKTKGITGSVVEDVQVDPISSALLGSTHYGMSFSRAVVLPDGKLIGVLTARVSLRLVESELRLIFDSFKAGGMRSGQAMLINRDGWLVAEASRENVTERSEVRRNHERILRWNVATQQGQVAAAEAVAGRAGSTVEVDRITRSEHIWGYRPVRDPRFLEQLGWAVVVSVGTDEILSDAISHQRWLVFGFLIVLVLFGLFGQSASKLISNEVLDHSNRLKDELASLADLGDGLGRVVLRSANADTQNHLVLKGISSTAQAITRDPAEFERTLTESVLRSRELGEVVSLSERLVQRSGAGMTLAKTSTEQLSAVKDELEQLNNKMSSFSEFIFRIQLAGTNAQIEAARSSTQAKGIALVAKDIESSLEQAGALFREMGEGIKTAQSRVMSLSLSLRRGLDDSGSLIEEARSNLAQCPERFSEISESMASIQSALQSREALLRSLCDSILNAQGSMQRTTFPSSDLKQGLHELQNQSDRLDELLENLVTLVKGQQHKNMRGRKYRSKFVDAVSVFRGDTQISPDQARADVVDRLAQKMRPRLVVQTGDSEPEVSGLVADESSSRWAG